MASIEGQCNCGAVRYTTNGEVQIIVNCHCNMCRSINGAAFSTYVVVNLTAGAVKIPSALRAPAAGELGCWAHIALNS
jgi:hypothetical protein